MNEVDAALDSIKAVVDATWTDVETKREGSASQERGWRELIERGEAGLTSNKMDSPFATLNWSEFMPSPSESSYCMKTLKGNVAIGYLTSKRKSDGTAKKTSELRQEINQALSDLQRAILAASGTNYVCYRCSIDSSEANAANDFLDRSKIPMRAGFVRAEVIVGYAL